MRQKRVLHSQWPTFTTGFAVILIMFAFLPAISSATAMIDRNENSSYCQFETGINGEDEQQEHNTSLNHLAVLTTSYGVIVFELYENLTPITTANFITLADERFYDGCKFHRVIDDFVIQTGDPNSKDNNPYDDGYGGSDETIPLEIAEELTHVDGAVGMARSSDPDSASSQFYICDTPQPHLDGDYAVFGLVVEGMDVVREIASTETWGYRRPLLQDRPVEDIVLESVEIVEQEPPELPEETVPRKVTKSAPAFESITTLSALLATVTTIITLQRRRNH